MKKPLVTISIPTLNSELFLEKCLDAILQQTYRHIEVIIVDGGSTDKTLEIAKKKNICNILLCKSSLLDSRYKGVINSTGKYSLLLDSDQILGKTTIERAVKKIEDKKLSMLALEENVYQPKSFIEKLFAEDRKLMHEVKDFSPFTGVILPRFYKTTLLQKAMNNIPDSVRNEVGGQDHAIIYFEAWKMDQNIDIVSDAVSHIEPSSYLVMWKKFYRWGKTSNAAHHKRYEELLKKKERFRTGLFSEGLIKASFASVLLLLLKGIPYKIGYFQAKFFN